MQQNKHFLYQINAKPADMSKRFVSIWFQHLTTDWMIRQQPELKDVVFVFAAPERGRMVVKAVSAAAHEKGIQPGMVAADCRTILPSLQVFDDKPERANKLQYALAEWCMRFAPAVAIDGADGLMLDVSGCPHLWGGERQYLKDIITRLRSFGYHVQVAIADTIGTAWAVCHYGHTAPLIRAGMQTEALLTLPPAALRIEANITERLEKLGLYQIKNFINMPRRALRRRFGPSLLTRLDQALGQEIEVLDPIQPVMPYQERLPCLEPIRTATGIEIALQKLLDTLCERLAKESKGLRCCLFKAWRIDGKIEQIQIGTNRPSRNVTHLFKLLEQKIPLIEPDLGIELFIIEAPVVEDMTSAQDTFWNTINGDNAAIAELLDKITGKLGVHSVHRYLPDEHYWPERSVKVATSLEQQPATEWRTELPRPIHLLHEPEAITVTVAIPDYPPVLFHYKGVPYNVAKADGPERIEQEWFLTEGQYRDYYCIEDDKGARYWLFRLGDYKSGEPKWFMHGFFA